MLFNFSAVFLEKKKNAENLWNFGLAGKILAVFLLIFLIAPFSEVKANNGQQSLPSALVFAVAQETIEKSLDRSDGSIYKLESLTRLPDQMLLPMGTMDLEPQLVGSMRYNTPIQVRVAVKINGSLQMHIVTAWRVKKIVNVLVAARDLPSRTIVSAEDFIYEPREIARIDEVVFDVESIIGLETKRPLSVGSVVSRSMLGKPQVIRSGDNVTILSKAGSVVVQAAGQALQSGSIGDVIRVRNLGSGKTILARIESESTVVITAATR